MEEINQNHDIVISRLEDIEDDMQVVQSNINVAKVQLLLVEREIRLLDSSMDNTHKQLKDLGDQVDGFVGSLCRHRADALRDTQVIGTELESFRKETIGQIESWSGRFERNNKIINKKFVQLDTELEKVVDLAGAKICTEVGVIATDFTEAMEIEEVQWLALEAKIASLEEKLGHACKEIARLSSVMVIMQGRVGDLEDAVMEDVEEEDAEGDTAVSTSSSEFDLVENMVAIPILSEPLNGRRLCSR
jgi:chromosome segregation ATPase